MYMQACTCIQFTVTWSSGLGCAGPAQVICCAVSQVLPVDWHACAKVAVELRLRRRTGCAASLRLLTLEAATLSPLRVDFVGTVRVLGLEGTTAFRARPGRRDAGPLLERDGFSQQSRGLAAAGACAHSHFPCPNQQLPATCGIWSRKARHGSQRGYRHCTHCKLNA
jgi:hypothetical protein